MGMFDTLTIVTSYSEICCREGHIADRSWDFQTKSLGCNMDRYYLTYSALLEKWQLLRDPKWRDDDGDGDTFSVSWGQGGWCLNSTRRLEQQDVDKTITVYTSCPKCLPVFTRRTTVPYAFEHRADRYLEPHRPWVELELVFRGGKLADVAHAKASQTREDLRAELARGGSGLLADDDPRVAEWIRENVEV